MTEKLKKGNILCLKTRKEDWVNFIKRGRCLFTRNWTFKDLLNSFMRYIPFSQYFAFWKLQRCVILMSLLLTWIVFDASIKYFFCWLWTGKLLPGSSMKLCIILRIIAKCNMARYFSQFKWGKVSKNGPSEICGREPLKIWSDMVWLNRPYHFRFFKGSLPQFSLGPFFE